MYISNLILKNFRNYADLAISFSPGINFIVGQNGTGKTNILEAISILANLKSFRGIADSEIIKWGEQSYFTKLELNDSDYRMFEIGFGSFGNVNKKKVKLDGVIISSTVDYFGKLLAVVFSPSDLNLITGPPDLRRRFIDSIISKINPVYLKELTEYKKILQSRNSVLKKLKESNRPVFSELDVWDELFAEKALYLQQERDAFILRIRDKFTDSYISISREVASPVLSLKCSLECNDKKDILKELLSVRKRDIICGFSNKGPHRDDYPLNNSNSVLFSNYGSQGQKRTAAIALKKSELEIIEESTKQKVIILVDDILSELDLSRRKNMIKLLHEKNQVIFTMVDTQSVNCDEFHEYRGFRMVENGIIEQVKVL